MNNITDQINFVSFTRAQRAAFNCIDRLQDYTAGEQVAAASLLFHLLCERFKQNPRDVMIKGQQVLLDTLSFGHGEHTRAIKTYLNQEI